MNVAILTIGDEICIGQVVNTNAAWIAAELTRIGARVSFHSIVGDDKNDMLIELKRLEESCDVIITTGGLGPTHDDITKIVLREYFNDTLVFSDAVYENIKVLFSRRGIEVTPRNRDQALVPSKSTVLRNSIGTAPGIFYEKGNTWYFSLPGVPSEMKFIMKDSIIKMIEQRIVESADEIVLYRNIQTTGIPESMLADLIGDPAEFLGKGSLAFLPSYQGVRLRIGFSAKDKNSIIRELDRIESIIVERADKYIYHIGDEKLPEIIGRKLKERKLTVSVAESCTGGMLGAAFTDNPGSSEYFQGGMIVYSNKAKIENLGVKKDTLDQYGAVSEETCREMAENVRKRFGTDFGISITGIAGPDGGTKEKPVGTVWIGIADSASTSAYKNMISTDRAVNRERSVGAALNLLLRKLEKK